MTGCHLCLTREPNQIMKCKLCCDGLEQEFCTECALTYVAYRAAFVAGLPTHELFRSLQSRRLDGIEKEKEGRKS
jgi:hypothetical protein